MKKLNLLFVLMISIIVTLTLDAQTQNALDFVGTNYDYVQINQNHGIGNTYSVECWINPSSLTGPGDLSTYGRTVCASSILGDGYPLWIAVNNSELRVWSYEGQPGGHFQTTGAGLVTNVWTHIAVTATNGGITRIYVNGVEIDFYTNDGEVGWNDNFTVGDLRPNREINFDGKIDDVRIWNTVRTEQEIRNNMYKELDNPTVETALVSYYKFNEGSGQTASDSKGSFDLTLGQSAGSSSKDPDWVSSTAPIPYYTVADGSWNTDATWETGQNAPTNNWANVKVNDDITVTSAEDCEDMTINSGASVTVNENQWLTVNGTLTNTAGNSGLVVKSSGSGTGSLIENSGANATIERYYTGNQWHFISSPISGATANMFLGYYLQKHTESTNAYTDVTDPSELLNVMQGYAIWNQDGNSTAQYAGALNTGTYGPADNMTRTVTGDNGGNNLVGNPYCSTIDWDAAGWTKTNMMASIYVEDNGGWGIYNTNTGSAGTDNQTNFIAPGQGFFVFVNDGAAPATGTLQMDNTVRVHNNTDFLKNTYSNYIKLMATGNDKSDFAAIRFMEDATPQFDGQYDAYKFFAYDESYPQLYSVTDKNLAINALPETEMIQLGFLAGIDGEYEIQSVEINDISEVSLEDTFTGTFTDLTSDSYYFNYTTGDDPNRFILHLTALSVEDNIANNTHIYSYDKDVYVTAPQNSKGTIQVYDMMGREIAQASISSSTNVITLNKSGYYVVKVLSDEGIATQKVFIK